MTFVGGRDGTAAGTGTVIGGGGIIGGEKGNVLTLTNVVIANNQVTAIGSGNGGGGGIQITGGDLNVTNCTIGGVPHQVLMPTGPAPPPQIFRQAAAVV